MTPGPGRFLLWYSSEFLLRFSEEISAFVAEDLEWVRFPGITVVLEVSPFLKYNEADAV
jgi:hypothetical protein